MHFKCELPLLQLRGTFAKSKSDMLLNCVSLALVELLAENLWRKKINAMILNKPMLKVQLKWNLFVFCTMKMQSDC